MVDRSTRILVAVDASNFEYVCIHAATKRWERYHSDESKLMLKDTVWETDQDNLPDLLVSQTYRKILNIVVQERLEFLNKIIQQNNPEEVDAATGVDYVFSIDGNISDNFRRKLYPGYKAQRELARKRYQDRPIKKYIQDVIFKELGLEDVKGYKMVKIDGCESDDIISVLMNTYPDYMCRILFSSDRDFLQIEGVNQYNCWGERILPQIKDVTDGPIPAKTFLLWKILRGDTSDNIKNVFPKYGDKKSYMLTQNKEKIKEMLAESNDAAERFRLNKTLIDFRNIPPELVSKIKGVLEEKMNQIEEIPDFSLDDCIIL